MQDQNRKKIWNWWVVSCQLSVVSCGLDQANLLPATIECAYIAGHYRKCKTKIVRKYGIGGLSVVSCQLSVVGWIKPTYYPQQLSAHILPGIIGNARPKS